MALTFHIEKPVRRGRQPSLRATIWVAHGWVSPSAQPNASSDSLDLPSAALGPIRLPGWRT